MTVRFVSSMPRDWSRKHRVSKTRRTLFSGQSVAHGVAEAAALAAAGPHGILAVEKTASVRTTAALAIAGSDAAPQFRKVKL